MNVPEYKAPTAQSPMLMARRRHTTIDAHTVARLSPTNNSYFSLEQEKIKEYDTMLKICLIALCHCRRHIAHEYVIIDFFS